MTALVRIGIVGAGRVGQIAHLAHYARDARVELALADIRPELRELVARRFGVTRVFGDHQAMLDAGVDAAVVVVRRPATGPVVLDALRAGAHVLSEKPMALTAADARRLIAAARETGRCYGVGYMKRHDRGVAALRDAFAARVADNILGELRAVHAYSGGGADGSYAGDYLMTNEERPDGIALWPVGPSWLPADVARPYEEHLNVHSHITNAVRYVLGSALTLHNVKRSGDRSAVVAVDATGTPVHFTFTDGRQAGAWREGMTLEFSRGALHLTFASPFAIDAAARVTQTSSTGTVALDTPGDAEFDGAFARQARAFITTIQTGTAFVADAEDALNDITFAEDVWRRLSSDRGTFSLAFG